MAAVLQRAVYTTTYLCNDCEKILVLSILIEVGKFRDIFYQFVISNLWSVMIQAMEHLGSSSFCVLTGYVCICQTSLSLQLYFFNYKSSDGCNTAKNGNYHKEKEHLGEI